jgi:hypothetical protein
MNAALELEKPAAIADELCFVKSLHTDAINHDPAITFFQTGSQLPGRPSMGAWTDYGLGRMNDNLPSFVVLISVNKEKSGQGLLARLWGSGFLPSAHQGVQVRPPSRVDLDLLEGFREILLGDLNVVGVQSKQILATVAALAARPSAKGGPFT